MYRPIVTHTILISLLALLTTTTALGQQSEPDLSIINARLVDGTGQIIQNATINVSGDRIQSVTVNSSDPQGGTIIDAAGKTVLPGLIDAHVHLLPGDISLHVNSDSLMAARIRNELPSELNDYLQSGITTVLSTGDFWPFIRDVRMQLESGTVRGPRLLTAGAVLTAPDGHPAVTVCRNNDWCREHMTIEVNNAKKAQQAVEDLSNQGVDAIKMVYDNRSPSGVEKLKSELVGVISEAAYNNGLLAYTHTYTTADAIYAIENGVDRLVHIPAFESKPGQREHLAEIMDTHGVTGTTTLTILDALFHRFTAAGDTSTAQALKQNRLQVEHTIATVAEQNADLLVFGTDAPMFSAGEAFHREAELLQKTGLTPRQIIKAATKNAAYHLGMEEELGTIEPGKIADLILIEGDPLKNLTALKNIELVVQGGKIVVDNRDK